ncbi:hypothetical protein CPB86DRAFT_784232 [Serendipita vermifera]|nr:hypothetical protein CPB86DRAFT_784232 [Serendipita vermifera]
MIEPIDEKEARSDHHSRQGMRKPGDRAKKFSNKNTPSSARPNKNPTHPSSSTSGASGSLNRTHGKRVNFQGILNVDDLGGSQFAYDKRTGSGSGGSGNYIDEYGYVRGVDDEVEHELEEETEREMDERAKMIMEGASEGTGPVTRGVDGIVLDETREAATVVSIEDLIASAYANKKPRKSRADQFDHIRGLGKLHQSVAPKSVKSSKSKRIKFPHEEDQDSDWESIGEDGTEAWEYNSEWRAEMGNIMNETLAMGGRPSYRDAAGSSSGGGGASVTTPSTASASGQGGGFGVVSLDGSVATESVTSEKTDDLP